MQYIFLGLGLIVLVLLVLVLLKLSKKGDDSEQKAQLSELSKDIDSLSEALRRVEQAQTVTSTRLDGMDTRSSQLNALVDTRLAQFSSDNDKLTKTVEGISLRGCISNSVGCRLLPRVLETWKRY